MHQTEMIQEDEIDLLELMRALWKNILIIALVAVLCGSAAFGVTAFLMEPQYQATASLTYFLNKDGELSASNSLVNVCIYILNSRTTMEDVIEEANLSYTPEALEKMVETRTTNANGGFEVTVTSSDPAEAERIANTIAKLLPSRVSETVEDSYVRVVDYAVIPHKRSGPNMLKNTAIGILAGAFLSAAVVVVMFLLDDKPRTMIQSPEELRTMYPDIMVLATIPDMRLSDKKNGYDSHYYEGEPNKKEAKANGSDHRA